MLFFLIQGTDGSTSVCRLVCRVKLTKCSAFRMLKFTLRPKIPNSCVISGTQVNSYIYLFRCNIKLIRQIITEFSYITITIWYLINQKPHSNYILSFLGEPLGLMMSIIFAFAQVSPTNNGKLMLREGQQS